MVKAISETDIRTLITYGRALVHKVPWRHQGRSLRGVDCVGLFSILGKTIGLDLDMRTNYTRTPNPADLEAGIAVYGRKIAFQDVLPGDFALIKYGAKAIHLVMITDRGILHCSADMKTVVEHSIDANWKRDIVSIWRLKGRFNG